jgi:carboxylate-amine ligase
LCAYLPAISASSPICEGKLSPNADDRLYHFEMKTQEISSTSCDVIPGYISSVDQFRRDFIGKYSQELANASAQEKLLHHERDMLRSHVFRFKREAIEVRIMDEQECIKSDVALSCFIRAAIRGLIAEKKELPPHKLLTNDYNAIVKEGLKAKVLHPHGKTARQVCQYFFDLASEHATENEKKYLWIIKRRIKEGSLSELIRNRVLAKEKKTTFREAVVSIYSELVKCLSHNQPYF